MALLQLVSSAKCPVFSCLASSQRMFAMVRTYAVAEAYHKSQVRVISGVADCGESLDTAELLGKLVNHEQQGVPDSAGAKSSRAFDLVSSQCSPVCSSPGHFCCRVC